MLITFLGIAKVVYFVRTDKKKHQKLSHLLYYYHPACTRPQKCLFLPCHPHTLRKHPQYPQPNTHTPYPIMNTLRHLFAASLLTASLTATAQPRDGGYPITPVPFTSVSLQPNTFWGQRLEASRTTTIPLAFSKCASEGRYDNFVRAAHPSPDHKVGGYSFDDTDVYKTIEGASYLLQTYPDPALAAYMDSVLTIVAAAQEADGYLYTSRTMNPDHPHAWAGSQRWEKVEDLSHEFYNLGHMVEGAVAHYQATGSRKFLDIAIRYADCVCRAIGPGEEQLRLVPGHQIAEMALCRLYLVTGERRYLDQARFFLDYRGRTSRRDQYSQAHLPVTQQREAVGHAVRAAYMYSGMADVAALTGDTAYIAAIDSIWTNIVGRKMYITGGIGSTSSGEAFGANYELPNMSAYCETCAAIGNVYVNHRLFLLHGHARYYDVLERSLYNGVISGVSIDGGRFFYPNPLESMGQHQRQAWFGCACCPSNVCRFIPSLPGYIYAVKGRNLYVNLFAGNTATIPVEGRDVTLTQHTAYPWDGDIALTIDRCRTQRFTLRIRIPGWVQGQPVPSPLYAYADQLSPRFSIRVNGQEVTTPLCDGYCCIDRQWCRGDRVDIHFDMEPRIVVAQEEVEADRGRIAVERGPLVYCAEWPDNHFDLGSLVMPRQPHFQVIPQPELLGGIHQLTTSAQTLAYDEAGRLSVTDAPLTLIPYYAWCHRGSGRMMVWLPQQLRAARPATPPTLASCAKLTASTPTAALSAVADGLVPRDANDRSIPYYHWWPKQGSTESLTYTFAEPTEVSRCRVYWFDDAPWGGCRVPRSWSLSYLDADGQWRPVTTTDHYGVDKGKANTVRFTPLTTTALRLSVTLPNDNSSGLYEWEVE